jgi:hypothetical protein
MSRNPYSPPAAPVEDVAPIASANARWYSPGQIAAATFLGTPIAGAWLMAQNYQAMRSELFGQTIIFGVIATLVVFFLAAVLPDSTPNVLLPAVYTAIVQVIARSKQGPQFQAHIASGGKKHSNWRVAGIGLLFMVVVLLFMVGVLFLIPESVWVMLEGTA